MSNPTAASEAEELVRRQIESLAAALVLNGPANPPEELARSLAADLDQIAEGARQAGWHRVAGTAAELAVACRDCGPDSQYDLQAGISRLQQVFDDELRTWSAEAPAKPAAEPQPTSHATSLGEDPELLADFVLESREHLASLETQLLTLEQDPENAEAVNSVFRSFHTIKGLAGFLDLAAIQEVAHAVESVLDLARNSRLAITSAVIDVVLASADYLKASIGCVESKLRGNGSAEMTSSEALLQRIHTLEEEQPNAPEPAPLTSELLQLAKAAEAPEPAAAADLPAPEAAGGPSNGPAKSQNQHAEAAAIRVDTGRLDYLVDMIGEMVIAESLVRHDPDIAGAKNPRLVRNLSQLTRITSEVQKTAMAMRMIPMGQVFRRMTRLVRDLSRKAGKKVELETSGDDTELDRTIVNELADPLMHMVRNSIDHGIEPSETRIAAGKNPSGRIRLGAQHQAGQILIELSDDGRGLDREKILQKARQKGLIPEDGKRLSDAEVFNLIFEPGFSTADQVTDVSGRGVGMDVVRKHIQKLRGRVDVQSVVGQGTKFTLKLPLTLAIIEGLIVGVGKERFIVPIFTVREMLRPTPGMVSRVQNRAEMALVRNKLFPVVRLHERFGIQPRSADPCQCLLILTESGDRSFCLMVDELIGKQEVVIKSLGETLKNTQGIAGGAILGDGRVGLILDVDGVFA